MRFTTYLVKRRESDCSGGGAETVPDWDSLDWPIIRGPLHLFNVLVNNHVNSNIKNPSLNYFQPSDCALVHAWRGFELVKTDCAAVLPQLVNKETAQWTFFLHHHFQIALSYCRVPLNRYSSWIACLQAKNLFAPSWFKHFAISHPFSKWLPSFRRWDFHFTHLVEGPQTYRT